jgi:hypothetical protein
MEHINGATVGVLLVNPSPDTHLLYNQVARARVQLLQVPAPEVLRLGPVGGPIRPCFPMTPSHWKYMDLWTNCNSISARYCTIRFSYRQNTVHETNLALFCPQFIDSCHWKIDTEGRLSNDRLCFCSTDVWADNFIITETGQTCVIDFEHTAFLPTNFMSYALRDRGKPLISEIAKRITLPTSEDLGAMNVASYIFKMHARRLIYTETCSVKIPSLGTPATHSYQTNLTSRTFSDDDTRPQYLSLFSIRA